MGDEQTWWLGRARLRGDETVLNVRVRTDGAIPGPADIVETIDDPFERARRDGGDPAISARTMVASPSGFRGPLSELRLVHPVAPGKIVCVGRNYLDHVKEMGNELPEEPLLFFKPPSALVGPGEEVRLPSGYDRIDMEAELVAVVGRRASRVSEQDALAHVAGYTLGNDVSCRDLQRRDPQWTRAKGFDTFAALGPWVRLVEPGAPPPGEARIQGRLDGDLRQDAPLSAMLFSVAFVVAYVSDCMTLEPGDVIYTGTPEGVSPLVPGNAVQIRLDGFELGTLENPIVARPD